MVLKGIIFSGGFSFVYVEYVLFCDFGIWDLGIFVLGVCYGMQLMVQQFGGVVEVVMGKVEYGKVFLEVDDFMDLFINVDNGLMMWMSYGDLVKVLFDGFVCLVYIVNMLEVVVVYL